MDLRLSDNLGSPRRLRSLGLGGRLLVVLLIFGFICLSAAMLSSAMALTVQQPIKLVVLPFQLEDFSAAGERSPTPREKMYLSEATAEAARQLARAGGYAAVELGGADIVALEATGYPRCDDCVVDTAVKLGAGQVLTGLVTRISRTEYTLQIRIIDAGSGSVVASVRSDLRVGADYSWSRGVRALLQNRLLAHN